MRRARAHLHGDQLQSRLLLLAGAFVFAYAAALTLAPTARARSWEAAYRWEQWAGLAVWGIGVYFAHRATRRLNDHDPYLLPVAALLSGWGLMTVYRLSPSLGLRQTAWVLVATAAYGLGLRLPTDLDFLRRYKYLWLTGGLLLTALTLVLGTNPLNYGPRLWLGCCGIYLQPSEPLKMLLVIYLAAYFADRLASARRGSPGGRSVSLLPVLGPTLIMTGLALLILVVQRDLGTATIFLVLYTVAVYLASGDRRALSAGIGAVMAAGITGYLLFDLVRLRIDAWLNPWLDPSGGAFQIVQSLLAVANGGVFGRGPGLGSPGLVPVAHSDFIFAAITEESGLLGAGVLILALALLANRGLYAAAQSPDRFRRYLAAGLTTHLIAQSIWIAGGNLRLLPLTGVTLPFISYGGSSLVTSFLSLMLLTHISQRAADTQVIDRGQRNLLLQLGGVLNAGLALLALGAGWWGFVRGPTLLTRTDNARRGITDRYVRRGALLDRSSRPIVQSTGQPGAYSREVLHPTLSAVVGYNHPVYGQDGLEAALDAFLRGLQGYPALTIWWNHLLYGQPPPGLNVRLTLDLNLQQAADQVLADQAGALVVISAENGEILAMATSPTFDANRLSDDWESLVAATQAPLLNRATLGRYTSQELLTQLFPEDAAQVIADVQPVLHLPTGNPLRAESQEILISPLQASMVAAALTNGGQLPAVHLVAAVARPNGGWDLLPPLSTASRLLEARVVAEILPPLQATDLSVWEIESVTGVASGPAVTWYLAGTMPDWEGKRVALALLLEGDHAGLAGERGRQVLQAAMLP